ncbi:MAG: Hsp20 family protein [Zymomonas mobilis subsp. pomaceae]|uniref:Hsp20 family protein n=1 Tax=Zymomonas mobilis TaxID=542 RepID=UPI0039ED4801
MRAFDLTPFLRSSVGFENINRLVDIASRGESEAFPPYNIEKLSENRYCISMAVAGFSKDELDVTVQDNVLTITGQAAENTVKETREYLHRGIAKRSFERRFQLADTIKIVGADYENGLLNIELDRIVPDQKKPRKIEIGGDSSKTEKNLPDDSTVSPVKAA